MNDDKTVVRGCLAGGFFLSPPTETRLDHVERGVALLLDHAHDALLVVVPVEACGERLQVRPCQMANAFRETCGRECCWEDQAAAQAS